MVEMVGVDLGDVRKFLAATDKTYVVISGYNQDAVINGVNAAMKAGWSPLGAPQYVLNPEDGVSGYKMYQALTRRPGLG